MQQRSLNYGDLLAGLMVFFVALFIMASFTINTHAWITGISGMVAYATVIVLAFRKMRTVYLSIKTDPTPEEARDFNAKVRGFMGVNLFSMLAFLAILVLVH